MREQMRAGTKSKMNRLMIRLCKPTPIGNAYPGRPLLSGIPLSIFIGIDKYIAGNDCRTFFLNPVLSQK